MKKFQCLVRPKAGSSRPLSEVERFQCENDDDAVDVVRESFMPGTLKANAFQVRQPFKRLAAPSTKKGSLGPARLATAGVTSKFLAGKDFSTKTFAVALEEWNSDEGSSAGSDAESEPEAPKIQEHEPLILHEPTDAERASGAQPIQVPPLLCQFLRPHQREGVAFVFECVYGLRENGGHGAILADDMGLGKTLQSIALIYTLLKNLGTNGEPLVKRAMVVCPCSLVKNWEDEFEKWINKRATTRGERVECLAIADSTRKTVEAMIDQFVAPSNYYDVIVLSYETFRAQHARFARSRRSCDLVVCDEAHRLKNGDAQTSKALASLGTRRRVLLSGTPMQNDLGEYFAMSDFTNPGIYGTREAFVKNFEQPILRGREPDAPDAVRRRAAERQSDLSRIADTFIIRRMNRLNAQHLPPKLTQVVCCGLSPTQRAMYALILRQRDDEQARRGTVKDTLGFIQRLQKVCNHPQLACETSDTAAAAASTKAATDSLRRLLPAAADQPAARGGRVRAFSQRTCDPELSGKMLVLHRLMRELRRDTKKRERIVVVSVFMTTLDLIEAMCEAEGWPSCKLGGNTSTKNRKKYNDEFNDPHANYFAFLLSSKAGGCGLNLIGGSRLVMFDLDWNPATDKQAAARCWRDGQKHQCYTYRFLSTGTLEERMLQRQLSKEGLQSVIEDTAQVNSFATDDLKRLFSYRPKTASDLHDELQCKACRGRAAAKKATSSTKLTLTLSAAHVCLDAIRSAVLTHAAATHFLKFKAPEGTSKDRLNKAKPHVDLEQICGKLEQAQYALIPDVLKDLKLLWRNCEKLYDDTGSPERRAAAELSVVVDTLWTGLVEDLFATNVAERAAQAVDRDVDDPDCAAAADETAATFKQQLYPLPKEDDLNNWSHHSTVKSIEDAVLKRALRDVPDAVTFVFGMYQDWDLIQADTAKPEPEQPAAEEDDDDDDAELIEVAGDENDAPSSTRSAKRESASLDSRAVGTKQPRLSDVSNISSDAL